MPFYALLFAGVSVSIGSLSALASENRPVEAATNDLPLVGTWEGTLDAGVAKLRVIIPIKAGSDRALVGSLDSPDQGVTDIPIDSISIQGTKVRLKVTKLMAEISGD